VPASIVPPPPPQRLFGPEGRLPTWAQWAVPLGVAALLVAGLILFVDHQQATANQPAPVTRRSALLEQNREARILVAEDQTPHTLAIARPTPGPEAIRLAVAAVMRAELRTAAIEGPLQRIICRPTDASAPRRLVYQCTAEAASVLYPFSGVVEPGRRRVTVCKRDLPPVPGMNVALSPRCT
jgi:hypothetical protein